MVRAFRDYPHLVEREAYLAADVLSSVVGRHIHISGAVERHVGRLALLVGLKEIELHLGSEAERKPLLFGFGDRVPQQNARAALEICAVRTADIAEHPHDSAVRRSPRKRRQRSGIGHKEKVALNLSAEALNRRGIERYSLGECARQLARHDGDVLRIAVDIGECKAYEFHVLLADVIDNFVLRVHM